METNKNEYILEIKNLAKSFGNNKVLKNVNINIKPGHIVGLMGENGAGKSTLMKCLFGIYEEDSGEVVLDGMPINFTNPKHALEHGIAMVHQELNQCVDLSIVDNMFLGRYFGFGPIVNEKAMVERCRVFLRELDLNYDPHTIMRTMSVSQRQMVEIAKATSYNSKVIVLDEPTSSLSEREVQKLFKVVRKLQKEKNISFIFISHKMDEVFNLCDDIVVLRDGKVTLDKEIKDTNFDEVVAAMIGRSLDSRFPELTNVPGEVVLEVHKLATRYKPQLRNINFQLRKGEILGIYGLVGSGRTELLEALFGVRTVSEFDVTYRDRKIFFKNSKEAMDTNFAFVTEERKVNGMYAKGDLTYNTCITSIDKFSNYGIVSSKMMNAATKEKIKKMMVKCNDQYDLISSLSGGNQQKVIVGKWLERNPDIFLMDEPTRGIDVMAKYQIYQLMVDLANQGKSVIMVSSEMPEILGVTNRIVVLSNYEVAGEVMTKNATEAELLKLCAKNL